MFAVNFKPSQKTLIELEVGLERAIQSLLWKNKNDRSTGVIFDGAVHDDTDNRITSQLIRSNFAKLNSSKQKTPLSTTENETVIHMVRHEFQKLVKNIGSFTQQPNISRGEMSCIKSLKEMESVIIKPAEKVASL